MSSGRFIEPLVQDSGGTTTQQGLTATLSFSGNIKRQSARKLAAVLSFAGAIKRRAARLLSATLSFTGALKRRAGKKLAGTLSFTGLIKKRTNKKVPNYPTLSETVLADSPVAFWRFQEATGATTFADSSGNNKSLTVNGTWTFQAAGIPNDPTDYSATPTYQSGYASRVENLLNFPITIEAVVKPTTTNKIHHIIHFNDNVLGDGFGGEFETHLSLNSEAGALYVHSYVGTPAGTPVQVRTPIGSISPGTEYHIVWVLATGTGNHRLYINGVKEAASTISYTPTWAAITHTLIGRGIGNRPRDFQGSINEIAIYHSAFTDDQVANHYGRYAAGKNASLNALPITPTKKSTLTRRAAVLSFTGALKGRANKALTATLSFLGTLKRNTARKVTAALSFTGVVSAKVVFQKSLAATLSFTGAIRKNTLRKNTATLSFAGNIRKAASRKVAAAVSFSGAIRKKTNRSLAAALSFTGALKRRVGKKLAGALSFTGALKGRANKKLAAALSFTGAMRKRYATRLAATLSFVGNLKDVAARKFAAALSFTGSVKPRVNKKLSGSLSFAGNIRRSIGKRLTATLSFVGSVLNGIGFPTTAILDTFTRFNNVSIAGIWAGPIYIGHKIFELINNTAAHSDINRNSGFSAYTTNTYDKAQEFYITMVQKSGVTGERIKLYSRLLETSGTNPFVVSDATEDMRLGDYQPLGDLQSLGDGAYLSPVGGVQVEGYDGAYVLVVDELASGANFHIERINNGVVTQLTSPIFVASWANGSSIGIKTAGTSTVSVSAFHRPPAGSWTQIQTYVDTLPNSWSPDLSHIGWEASHSSYVFDNAGGGSLLTNILTKAFSATLSFAGLLRRRTNKRVVAGLTFTGQPYKRIATRRTATLSFTGNVVKQTRRKLAAALGFAGSLRQRANKYVAASLSFSGAIRKRTARRLSATLSFAGALRKRGTVKLAGTLSFTPAIKARANKRFSAVLSFSGFLKVGGQRVLQFAASLSFNGRLSKRVARRLAGTLGFTGRVGKRMTEAFAGSISFAGGLRKRANRRVLASLTPTGVLRVRVGKRLTAALDFSADYSIMTRKALFATLSFAGSIRKNLRKRLIGSVSFAGNLRKRTSARLQASLSFSGRVVKRPFKRMAATLSFSGTLARASRFARTLAATLSFNGILSRSSLFIRRFAANLSFVGTIRNSAEAVIRELVATVVALPKPEAIIMMNTHTVNILDLLDQATVENITDITVDVEIINEEGTEID